MEHADRFNVDDGRYRLLVDAVTDYAIYMIDPHGMVSSWNAGAQRLKGYREEEVLGHHFSRFYTDEDRQAGLPARALETAATKGKFEAEGWRIRKDGTRFWAHVVIDPIRDRSGSLLGYAKITRDLSEREQAAHVLKQSEDQFKLLVQAVTDYSIYMLSPDGLVTNWNAGAQRIKGYRPEEIIGQHFSRFYTEEDRQQGAPAAALAVAIRDGRFEKEGLRVRKDGTQFWANVVIDPVTSPDGKLLGFAKITRDITEKREAQRVLEEARETLFQSQKMDAIGRLTGGIAHDFNNLLMAVLGSLELVRKRLPEDHKILSLIDNAIKGARRGTALTQRMLAFARRQELNPEPVDVPELINGMTDLLQRSLGPMIAVETQFPLKLGAVLADANQLELAMLNLAVNARDAMPDGGPLVIAAREETIGPGSTRGIPAGCYVCLGITDRGEGMDETTLQRAMEPFFTTKGIGKGTGLGLSMVHGMTEQLGGKLILKSKQGEGTTAEIWLPLADANAEVAQTRAAATISRQTRPLVVLAVDDDSLVLMNTASMLEDLGHTVFQAYSGKDAIAVLAREESIDLVITDQAMPQMTGLELAEAIKAQWPKLPIVVATGYAELPLGAFADLPKLAKPFGQEELATMISDVMQKPAASQILKFRTR